MSTSTRDALAKKQSWLEFIHESIGNQVKNEPINYHLNGISSISNNTMNYPMMNSQMHSLDLVHHDSTHYVSNRVSPSEQTNHLDNKHIRSNGRRVLLGSVTRH
jgi:hypothetical protein